MHTDKIAWLGLPALLFGVAGTAQFFFAPDRAIWPLPQVCILLAILLGGLTFWQFWRYGWVPEKSSVGKVEGWILFSIALVMIVGAIWGTTALTLTLILVSIGFPIWWVRNPKQWSNYLNDKLIQFSKPFFMVVAAAISLSISDTFWGEYASKWNVWGGLIIAAIFSLLMPIVVYSIAIPAKYFEKANITRYPSNKIEGELPPPPAEAAKIASSFDWNNPSQSRPVFEELIAFPQFSILHLLWNLKEKLPENTKLISNSVYMLQLKLESDLEKEIHHRIDRNRDLGNNPGECFCIQCKTWAKRYLHQHSEVICCPQCLSDTALIQGTHQVIGTMHAPNPIPDANGRLLLNAWDHTERCLIQGEWDGFWIPSADDVQVEHYVAAILLYADNFRRKNHLPYQLYAEQGQSLSLNTQLLLSDAQKSGTAQLYDWDPPEMVTAS